MVEYEDKIMLSYDEYLILMEYVPNTADGNSVQSNYYYDTDDYKLDELGITCRIREKNGKITATIKDHSIDSDGCSIEYSRDIASVNDTSLFEKMDVKFQGKLVTERNVFYSCNGCEAVIDKNSYLGYCDYELEIEYVPEQEKQKNIILCAIANILCYNEENNRLQEFINRKIHTKSKSARFFAKLKSESGRMFK